VDLGHLACFYIVSIGGIHIFIGKTDRDLTPRTSRPTQTTIGLDMIVEDGYEQELKAHQNLP
jgi:hypothetical protein